MKRPIRGRASRPSRLRPIIAHMRHFRLWLVLIGLLSLVAEAIGAAAVFWRAAPRRTG